MMKAIAALIIALALGGCMNFMPVPDYTTMTAAAIKASQERDGAFTYFTFPTPLGPAKGMSFDIDKGVITGKYKYKLNVDGSFEMEGEAAPKVAPGKP